MKEPKKAPDRIKVIRTTVKKQVTPRKSAGISQETLFMFLMRNGSKK